MKLRRVASVLATLAVAFLTSCNDGDTNLCKSVQVDDFPVETVKAYKIVLSRDIPPARVELVVNAAFEWVTASSGAVAFEVTYSDFRYTGTDRPKPPLGEMWIYTEPNNSNPITTIGVCWSYSSDSNGRPGRSEIWVQSNQDDRTFYLTAMHEIGHGLGLKHHEQKDPPSIMFPYITDVGDHPTCYDRQTLCQLWGCAPGC